jgi:beta-glucanase (GH16 family)
LPLKFPDGIILQNKRERGIAMLLEKLAWRQVQALNKGKKALWDIINGKNLIASLVVLAEVLGCLFFDLPMTPSGPELDLTGYELVFEDEFEGDALDLTKWTHRGEGRQRGGFSADHQVRVENGNMIIKGEYLENGKFGPGWYAGMVKVKDDYKFGYFEIRCICNPGGGFWSAFWLQSNYSYNPEISRGGVGGAEIDIMEAMSYNSSFLERNGIHQTIWVSGMTGDPTNGTGLNKLAVGKFYGNNIYEEYNTYGLKWDENEYIFYVNGVETARTSFADGTSKVPEQVIVSLCVPQEINHSKDFTTEFIVDYVRIYQKAD